MISLRALLLIALAPALALVLAGGPAWAADKEGKSKPRRIIVQPLKPAEAEGLRPTLAVGPPPVISLPPPMAFGSAFNGSSLASNGIASGGLRSGLPVLGDGGGQCRSRCTTARVMCDAQDATPECAPRWAICTADCGR